jgi:hypothetical protein
MTRPANPAPDEAQWVEAAFPGDDGESPLANPKCPWHGWFKTPRKRESSQTDAQWEASLRAGRHSDGVCGAKLYMFQALCTHWQNHLTCKLKSCARQRACSGRRDPNDWSVRFRPVVPPCVPLDDEVIEKYRIEIRAELNRRLAAIEKTEKPASWDAQ